MDATALSEAIAAGRVSARAVMAATLDACAAAGGLGAVVSLLPREVALALADAPGPGPFLGVPMLAKDLGAAAAGLVPGVGSSALRRRLSAPDLATEGALMRAFRAGGLIPMGLSTVPEFGFALSAEPPGGPVARNPFDPARSPGGSSGGAAAAVAGGLVAIAHGTDAAGSIRVPAAACGLWGLKPSRGAVVEGPVFANHLMGIAAEGVLARSLRDVAAAHDLARVPGPEMPLPDAPRIGVAISPRVGADQAAATWATAHLMEAAGCTLTDLPSPDALGAAVHALIGAILAAALATGLDALGVPDDEISPLAAASRARGRAMTGTAVFALSNRLAELAEATRAALFSACDAVLMPVLSGAPPPLGHFPTDHTDIDAHLARMEALAPNAGLANLAGLPALAMPAGMAAGLPVGVQLIGPAGTDRALLRLAARIALPRVPYPAPIAGMPA